MNIEIPLAFSPEPLYGFTGDYITPKRIVRLAAHLKELWVVTSIHYLYMKFVTDNGVATMKGNQHEARKCYKIAQRKTEKRTVDAILWDVEMEDILEEADEEMADPL
ncbi:Uncharacterized protein Adt_45697 [Abeliophyllum distichum]|uniref:Uncharacterized protein n=1 Tax=Abeliophyllum distichum TaxID=126358 RepID=A0ABD1PF42_9LAMI